MNIPTQYGSAWVVDIFAGGQLSIANATASNAKISGGGFLRAASKWIELTYLQLNNLDIIRPITVPLPTNDYSEVVNPAIDAVVQLQPVSGPLWDVVGSTNWIKVAN